MTYFFPSIILSGDLERIPEMQPNPSVNSGENAVRLLLRSYNLAPGSRVALPVYVCDSLKQAVLREGLDPFYLDLKPDGTFWTNYDFEKIQTAGIKAVILVHLYGFIHPDTLELALFCKKHNLFLLHDAAQSYGIDEKKLSIDAGLVYSFGPGKSSAAAGGALVYGLAETFCRKNVGRKSDFSIQALKAKLFLKSRLYGYRFSVLDKILSKYVSGLSGGTAITAMTPWQFKVSGLARKLVSEKKNVRERNYRILAEAIEKKEGFRIVYDDAQGLYFKMIFAAPGKTEALKKHLGKNEVPFFSLIPSLKIGASEFDRFPEFQASATEFVELSTEASVPEEEMKRIARCIEAFNNHP